MSRFHQEYERATFLILCQGRIQRFWKRRMLYVGHNGWATRKILDFRCSKGQINGRNYKFLAKYFFQYFQIFSIFIYNESLPIKSYQFSKIYKRFHKEKEKTLTQQSMRKEKLRKVGTGYFIKPFKITINHFFFNRSFCSQDFVHSWTRAGNLWFPSASR